MKEISAAYPKKVQRLQPTLENLQYVGESIVCVFLIPIILDGSIVNAARMVCHSPREALEELLLPTPFACIMAFGGLGYGICALFHDLIFGSPD